MTTKKIVIDATAFSSRKAYGFQEFLFNLLDYFYENFKEFECQQIYLVCDNQAKDNFCKYSSTFSIKSFDCDSVLKRLLLLENIHKKLKLNKNDLIFYTANYGSLFKRTKQLIVVHDTLFLHNSLFFNNWRSFLFRMQRRIYFKFSLKNADHIVAISNFTKKELLNNFDLDSKKISTIYNYFNFKKFAESSEIKQIINSYFLVISSSAFHKNIKFVIDSYCEYCVNHGVKHDLCIVGNMNKFIQGYISRLPKDVQKRIRILKHLENSELSFLYRNAECYISASRYEGLGMPIVEAMYFNLKIVLFDTEIHREVTANKAFYFSSKLELIEFLKSTEVHGNNATFENVIYNMYSDTNTSKKYIELLNFI